MPIAGECFCGEVRYEVEGKLRDARSCHCSRCRKAFGSQASAYALANSEEFMDSRERASYFIYRAVWARSSILVVPSRPGTFSVNLQ